MFEIKHLGTNKKLVPASTLWARFSGREYAVIGAYEDTSGNKRVILHNPTEDKPNGFLDVAAAICDFIAVTSELVKSVEFKTWWQKVTGFFRSIFRK